MKKNYLFFIIFIFLGSTFLRPAGVVVSEEDALAKDLLGSVFSFYDILRGLKRCYAEKNCVS